MMMIINKIGWVTASNLIIAIIVLIIMIYIIGRIFARGFLHETDNYINHKFTQLKFTKKSENGTKDKEQTK